MVYSAAIVGIVAIVALILFFWNLFGSGSGRSFGNRIAAHIGIPKSLFYTLLRNGTKGSYQDLLVSLEKSELDLDQASVEIAPSLTRGIERLEERFGPQDMYNEVKPGLAKLMAAFEEKQGTSAT